MPALPRHFMVRDISQYLADTYGMSPEEAYAFNNLEIFYWLQGTLPNSREKLAVIAQIPLAAWSMIEHRVMHTWALGADGHFHHLKIQKMRESERDKALKRQEHARRAAMARWHPEERRPEGEIPANTTDARASIEHETNVTTSLAGSPSRALPLLDPLIKSNTMRAREDDQAPIPTGQRRQHRSVIKAKPSKSGTRARREAADDLTPIRGRASLMAALRVYRKRGSGAHSDGKNKPAGKDTRFESCRREIFAMWARLNLQGPNCTWQTLDINALDKVLREHVDLTLDQFKSCIKNVEISIHAGEISRTKSPRSWLPRVVEFLTGPLDRYYAPLTKARERVRAPVRQL